MHAAQTDTNIKAVNIRLAEELWVECKALSDETGQSFNRFAEEAFAAAVKEGSEWLNLKIDRTIFFGDRIYHRRMCPHL